jgi:hypothetical protein
MILQRIFVAIMCVVLSACQTWTSWRPEHPDNERFKKMNYGYGVSQYSLTNIQYLEKITNLQVNNGSVVSQSIANTMRNKTAYSRGIILQRNASRVKAYIKNHNKILKYAEPEETLLNKQAQSLSYFNTSDYVQIIPIGNVLMTQQLFKNGVIPMTKEMKEEFILYDKYNGGDDEQYQAIAEADDGMVTAAEAKQIYSTYFVKAPNIRSQNIGGNVNRFFIETEYLSKT